MNFKTLDKKQTMAKRIYELHKILGKYCAYETDHVSNIDTCGEIRAWGGGSSFEGAFEADIYHFGELTDIELNGWTFGCHFEGKFHDPGSYYNTSFEIECIDPYDTELRLYSTPYKIKFSEEEVLCNYLDTINIYSQFEDADIAIKFNKLSRTIDEGMTGGRGREPMKLTYEDIFYMIRYFKKYYKDLEKNSNRLFLKKIQETVNGSLDYLKKRLELDKIE